MDARISRDMSGMKEGKRRGRDGKEWTLEVAEMSDVKEAE